MAKHDTEVNLTGATVSRADAKTMAVFYDAYTEANSTRRGLGIKVYGRGLLELQEKTGVCLRSNESLQLQINSVYDDEKKPKEDRYYA